MGEPLDRTPGADGPGIRVNDPRPLRDWVASFEQNSRDRREALSAAVLIYKTAFDGKVFDYDDLKPARRAPQIRKQELSDRDLILLLRRIFEANQTAGSILTWAALSGQRLSAIVCSQWAWELPFELSETEPKKIKLWENKVHQERAGFMWPLWPELVRELETISGLCLQGRPLPWSLEPRRHQGRTRPTAAG